MSTCDTCKWWDKFENNPREELRERGVCKNPKLLGYDADGLAAGECFGYEQEPYTGPKFGCVHHEQKPL